MRASAVRRDEPAELSVSFPRTVFDHLPKTAGTSVSAALSRALGVSNTVVETSYPHHVAVRGAAQTCRLVAGHLWFFPGEALAAGWYYATLLRDPIDRFVSQYYFYRSHANAVRRGNVRDADVVAAVQLDLLAYLQRSQARLATNFQARHFAWRACDAPERLSDTQLFEAAVASLREYDLLGEFADVQGFVDVYCDALAVERQTVPHVNRTVARPELGALSASVMTRLRETNAVDLALCDWAREQFLNAQRDQWRERMPRVTREPPANFGSRRITIVSSRCEGRGRAASFSTDENVRVTLRGHAAVDEHALTIGIAVRTRDGTLVHATNTHWLGVPVRVSAHSVFAWTFVVPPLPPGEYSVTLALHQGVSHLDGCYHWVDDATSFIVR